MKAIWNTGAYRERKKKKEKQRGEAKRNKLVPPVRYSTILSCFQDVNLFSLPFPPSRSQALLCHQIFPENLARDIRTISLTYYGRNDNRLLCTRDTVIFMAQATKWLVTLMKSVIVN